jgi:hypothetical protein
MKKMNKYYEIIKTFGRVDVYWAQGYGFIDSDDLHEHLKQQTKTTDTDNPEGKDVQDRANDSGEQTGMGEGKD